MSVEIPWTSGHATSLQNFGSVENKGLEVGLHSENIQQKEWNWSTDFNISFNRNKVLSINAESDSYISGNYIVQVGKTAG
ncbi:MAG: hypothetical protein LUE93_07405 [Bacteroides sp.]|nr:hypothetical protein [Bacteroides sp.]